MKKLLFIAVAMLVVLASCKDENKIQKWEYMRVKTNAVLVDEHGNWPGFSENFVINETQGTNIDDSLNTLGQEGWEIVGVYTKTSTTFPNFGNAEYVTGLRDQVATRRVVYVLKRPYIETEKKEEKTDSVAKK